ncbi:hypothetical protein BH09BAC6_BH09BAC6_24440 [soil metagenome]
MGVECRFLLNSLPGEFRTEPVKEADRFIYNNGRFIKGVKGGNAPDDHDSGKEIKI